MIADLVQRVGTSAESIIAIGLNLEKKGKMYKCPSPHNHKNGDNNPSMGWVKDKYYFNCLGCGENIDIYSYYRRYLNYTFSEIMAENGIEDINKKVRSFKNEFNAGKKALTEDQIKYLKNRGISEDTYRKFKIFNHDGCIAFPYFLNGTLTGVKKRLLNPKEGQQKLVSISGSKYHFFNCDNVDFNKPLLIVEGEFDCLIAYQAAYQNVVSVPCGANSVSTLFEQAGDFLNKFSEIILASDNDEYGKDMEDKFISEFNNIALVNKDYYLGEKDINDLYLKHHPGQVSKLIESGKRKFDGEWNLEENPYQPLSSTGLKFIPTGIDSVDYAINDICTGTVTLVTGRSNAGKSTFVNQIMASAINNEFKTYGCLGEGDPNKIINKWYTSMIGYDREYYKSVEFNKRWIKEPKPEALKAIREWHKDKLRLYIKSMGKYKTTDQLFDMLHYKVKTEKYDLIILDNLMSLLYVSQSSEKNEEQGKFIERCHALAQSYNVAVIVVLHPNKTYEAGTDMAFEKISGSSDIYNKADVILNVIRVPETDTMALSRGVTAKIQIAKNRDYSDIKTIDCVFDLKTNTFMEFRDGEILNNVVTGWKKYL